MRTVAETPIFQRYAPEVWTTRQGKRGGARVIDFNADESTIWLLIVYTKAKFDNVPSTFLAELRQGVEDAL